jgi:hypothetical protein
MAQGVGGLVGVGAGACWGGGGPSRCVRGRLKGNGTPAIRAPFDQTARSLPAPAALVAPIYPPPLFQSYDPCPPPFFISPGA